MLVCQLTPKKLNYLNLQLIFFLTSVVGVILHSLMSVQYLRVAIASLLTWREHVNTKVKEAMALVVQGVGCGKDDRLRVIVVLTSTSTRKFLTSCFSFVQQISELALL
jgi:hypothetical protein